MGFFSADMRNKFRSFFENSGVLFPKGKREPVERRSGDDRREYGSVDYLAVKADVEDRRGAMDRRESEERRDDKGDSPLNGML